MAQIGRADPIQIDYTNGVLNLQRTTILGTDTDLQNPSDQCSTN